MADETAVATAEEYRKRVSNPTVPVSSGLNFRMRTLEFLEFMDIANAMMKEFPKVVTTDNVFAVATNAEHPEVMWAYAKKALPLAVVKPKMVAEKGTKSALAVTELAPMDIIRLNMATMMGSTATRELMESFRKQESTPDIGDSDSDSE